MSRSLIICSHKKRQPILVSNGIYYFILPIFFCRGIEIESTSMEKIKLFNRYKTGKRIGIQYQGTQNQIMSGICGGDCRVGNELCFGCSLANLHCEAFYASSHQCPTSMSSIIDMNGYAMSLAERDSFNANMELWIRNRGKMSFVHSTTGSFRIVNKQ